jgi:hypothetical protein
MDGHYPLGYTLAQCHQCVTHSTNYQLILGQLYKLGADGILHRCALEHKWKPILHKAHEGVVGGQNTWKYTMCKVFHKTIEYITRLAEVAPVKIVQHKWWCHSYLRMSSPDSDFQGCWRGTRGHIFWMRLFNNSLMSSWSITKITTPTTSSQWYDCIF